MPDIAELMATSSTEVQGWIEVGVGFSKLREAGVPWERISLVVNRFIQDKLGEAEDA